MSFYGDLLRHGIDADGTRIIFRDPVVSQEDIGLGKVFYVDPVNGSDTGRNGQTPREALASIGAAHDLCTAGRHDTVKILAGSSSLSIATGIDWDKDYTHLVGVAAPTQNARARLSAATALPLTVSADGCRIENIRIFQGNGNVVDQALNVTGSRNFFYNVAAHGQGHATSAGSANAGSLVLDGASENRFFLCEFGLDTVTKTAGYAVNFDGSSARNQFIRCLFTSACETAAISLIQFEDTAAMDRYTWFDRCLFYNFSVNHANVLDEVFTIPGSAQTHDFILQDPIMVGFTEWAKNDRGSIWVNGAAAAAGTGGTGSSGKAVEPS